MKNIVIHLIFAFTLYQITGGLIDHPTQLASSTSCPQHVDLGDILTTQQLFFTMPSSGEDEPSLELWYADHMGTHATPITTLTDKDILEISPDNNSILVLSTSSEVTLPSQNIFDFGGTYVSEVSVISVNNFATRRIDLPESAYGIRLGRQIYWLDSSTALLISTPEEQKFVTINIETGNSNIEDWISLPDLNLEYPGGYLSPSPNGQYILYTVMQPLIGFPFQMAWQIANQQGEVILNYIAGVGDTAVWLADTSGIIVRDAYSPTGDNQPQFSLLFITLNGDQIELMDDSPEVKWGVINGSSTHVAYVSAGDPLESNKVLQILDIQSRSLFNYCTSYVTALGTWSNDNQLFAYKTNDFNSTQISILDLQNNLVSTVLPYQPANDLLGEFYIRIVGWKN